MGLFTRLGNACETDVAGVRPDVFAEAVATPRCIDQTQIRVPGHGLLESRPPDSFGVGLHFYNFSNDPQSAVSPLVGFEDEQGLEAFYSLALLRWLRVGADLQVVNPAWAGNDVSVGGVRLNVAF